MRVGSHLLLLLVEEVDVAGSLEERLGLQRDQELLKVLRIDLTKVNYSEDPRIKLLASIEQDE